MIHTRILVSIAAVAALSACGGKENTEKKMADVAEELPVVDVAVASVRDVDQARSYTANVEAFNTNNINPATANRIKSITVDVGDRVRRGQVLVRLDNSTATQLKVNLDQIEREWRRAQQLLKIGSGTQAAVDQLHAQYDAAHAQYLNVLENTTLTSPMNGVVTARNLHPGDMASGTPILTIGQINPKVKVLINISETDRADVTAGTPVTVTFDAFPDETFPAVINRIHPSVDPSTRTFQAEVLIDNPSERIFPGMFARVNLSQGTRSHVVVPDRAIVKQTGSGNKYVYVYRNGRVEYCKVDVGQRLDDAYELLGGIAGGDTVVIAGQGRLADGIQVQLHQNKKK
ncbi:MAG: efflux RND transporter periplasmic adaptor subunit [Bacteroidales bacterium]|nr:efflux RND transporter periplasmic adaptor subunit [Bacteroidales bacterium]